MLGVAELLLLGLLAELIFRRLRLPGLIGLLLVGLAVGPHALGWVSPGFLAASDELRMLALVVILLRAGLQIDRRSLNSLGRPAFLLSFFPGVCEGVAIFFLAPLWTPLSSLEAGLLGFVLAAVSPAVVVPMMIDLQERGLGVKKGIPTMVLAASSVDDVVAVVIFSVLLGVYVEGGDVVSRLMVELPFSLVSGVAVGVGLGVVLVLLFDRFNPRATKRLIGVLAVSIVLIQVERWLVSMNIWFSALLAIVTAGIVMLERREAMAHELSEKLGKVWIFASVLLFILIGAQVDIGLAWEAGGVAVGLVLCGLLVRSAAVLVSVMGTSLTVRERFFVMVSFWPKATVQAAIGAVPLAVMLERGWDTTAGEWILAVAVVAILITAPAGALAIRWSAYRWLHSSR